MKIVYISFMEGVEGGGSAIVAEELACSFRASDAEVVFISTQREHGICVRNLDGQKRYSFRPRNLYWIGDKENYSVSARIAWQTLDIWNPHVYCVIRKILSHEKPDVVHIHKLRGLSPSVFSAARDSGCTQIVHTLHDHELISPEGTLYGKIGHLVWRNFWGMRYYQAARRSPSKAVDCITAPSQYLLNTVTERGFFSDSFRSVIPNSHGLSKATLASIRYNAATKQHKPSGLLRLLYLGRLDTKKGIEFFCRVFIEAYQRFPQMHLDIVGNGPAEASVIKLVSGHPAITLHGALYNRDKAAILAKCDLTIIPSICAENAPLTLVEAYANGMPVLASDIGGIPEMIIPGKTGLILPPNDLREWVECVVSLRHKLSLLGLMSQTCFDQATRYTPEIVSNAYRRIYNHRAFRA